MKRLTVLLAAVCGLVLIVVGAAVAAPKPGIDESFGTNGVVDLGEGSGGHFSSGNTTVGWAAAPDGSSFVLRGLWTCPRDGSCRRAFSLQRYGSDGAFDQGFGGTGTVSVAEGIAGYGRPALAVDAEGRPVVAWSDPQTSFVARYFADGAIDSSFGAAGQVSFPCECEASGLTVLPDGKLLLRQDARSQTGATVTLRRLWSTGALDTGFGDDGAGAQMLPRATTLYAARPNGSVVFAGPGACCSAGTEGDPYVGRVSVAGKQDLRFEKAARKAVLAVPGVAYGQPPSLTAIIARPDGQIDILGNAGDGGFVLRLKANGNTQRSFANKGVRVLSRAVNFAVRDAAGGIFAVGTHPKASAAIAFRLFGDGRPDRRFKNFPLTADRIPAVAELELAAVSGLRALVYAPGYSECRHSCVQSPRMAMFQEPRPGKRP